MTESTTDRRARLTQLCSTIAGAESKNDLIAAIDAALAVPAPSGDPDTLKTLAKRYRSQADEADDVRDRVDKVARQGLPNAWVGTTGARAGEVVAAASRSADQMACAFRDGAQALLTLADVLVDARKRDQTGREQLNEARGQLGGEDGWFDGLHEDDGEEQARVRARSIGTAGVDERLAAAVAADDAARAAARDLNKYAAEARAGQMRTDNLSAADRLVLADTSNIDGDRELNEILTANDLERAGTRMEKLSAADQDRMERLLADAKTPQERAYIMKSLAAGYDVDQVEDFAGKIHGKDPRWLQEHLAPVTTNGWGQEQQTYGQQNWSQDGSTCVPSSTVTARAMVDPVYALGLTGGPDGTDDSPEAFRERLTDEQMRLHEEGDGANSGWLWDRQPAGMDSEGQEEISDSQLSPHTGDRYDVQEMGSDDDRRDVLTDIEKSVAEGKPVPINVEGHEENGDWVGHGMMIVGQEGNMLQIYNPWGTTTWVSEEDFVKGDLSAASDDRFDNVNNVYIEQG